MALEIEVVVGVVGQQNRRSVFTKQEVAAFLYEQEVALRFARQCRVDQVIAGALYVEDQRVAHLQRLHAALRVEDEAVEVAGVEVVLELDVAWQE